MTVQQYINEIFNTYLLVKVLSDKNGCRVMQLRNRQSGRDLVLKCFENKVHAYEELCKIKSNNLPTVFDVISLDDGQAVLEEFIDGITVAQVMEAGKYNYCGARKVIRGVCSALNVLHGMGLVHRDVKPENIIIGKDGRVILIDFNASRRVSAATRDTVVMGTVGYASPEQLGVAQSDSRTDIYAVGVLLNVMLTGKHPSEILARGKAGRIVRKCTAVNPDERYQTVKRLSEIL